MKQFDAAVIGGGILGCFAARNLRRWNISTILIEKEEDVCKGITRANTAIVYPGYDNKPGSLKAEMTFRGNADFDRLCDELEVPFSRCGSLMVASGLNAERVLQKKLRHGEANGVPGLKLLSGQEARELEPTLSETVTSALYCPTTGTVNPWQLGIAAFENARDNGCHMLPGAEVGSIAKTGDGYRIETGKGPIHCRVVINCAGADADKIQELLFSPGVRLRLDGADFLVLDKHAAKPRHIIFQEAEEGKGITAVPCVEGNLLLDSPARPMEVPYAATREGMDFIRQAAAAVLPGADLTQVIRSFGALRPNPHREDGRNLSDFCIENPGPGFFSLIGIKTPGLTCANELSLHVAQLAAGYLQAEENPTFDPRRRAIAQKDNEIICQCEQITKAEIVEAIRRGAVTVDGVKRRVGSGMGPCQGSRCAYEIQRLLEEYGHGTL